MVEGEVVRKVVFPNHHDQHFEKACPRVVKHFSVFGKHDKEDHAESDERRYVNHEELDQLVDHLVVYVYIKQAALLLLKTYLDRHVSVLPDGRTTTKHEGHLNPGKEQGNS